MDSNVSVYRTPTYIKVLVIAVGVGIVLTTVIFAMTIATFVKVNKGFDEISSDGTKTTTSTTASTFAPGTTTNPRTMTSMSQPSTITSISASPSTNQPSITANSSTPASTNQPSTTTNPSTPTSTNQPSITMNPSTSASTPSPNMTLATYIRIQDVMIHLNELQKISNDSDGNRAINTPGFNRTLDYIYETLSTNTDYNITTTFFPVRRFSLDRNPIFISSINDTTRNHTYSTNFSVTEFFQVQYSTSTNFTDPVPISVIPNLGCDDSDWLAADPSGLVALVKRGNCSFVEKGTLASKYNVSALLIYNDGTTPDRVQPIYTNLGQANELPALFLSYTLGQELADAAQDSATNVSVLIDIAVKNELPFPVGNICADTLTGDPTQTIVIGSHSDGVPEGPGINDNGSGSAANLGLAIALARLFQTSTYEKYKYRVRFCWWGAEEVGLLGSDYHVKQAKISNDIGERLEDYLINLNYDMLGSPNYIFGVYDGRTANNNTPVQALPGSNKITASYRDWFIGQNLTWDPTDFSGRSDYGPFLAEGIVAGGLFSGGDGVKTQAQHDRYEQILGQGMGGTAGDTYDPCYHLPCDSIENINEFAYDKLVQAAAYVLEYLARQDDLGGWLYPDGRPPSSKTDTPEGLYNSINEYFGLPYL